MSNVEQSRQGMCLPAGGVVAALALFVALSVGAAPAQAAFPGENGRLACEGQRGAESPLDRTEVFTVNPDGTQERVLTSNTSRDGDPSFSPDGANIAFESFRDGFSEAYRMGADGSNPRRLTTSGANEDRSTNWSPDGTKIAFHSTRDTQLPTQGSPFEIYVMDADGSNQRRITNNTSQDSFPQWSPDGSRLTFTTNRDGGDFEIYTMNPDGTDPRRVTESTGEDAHSTWSPDGKQLTFHSRRAGGIEIFRQNADGSGKATQVTNAAKAGGFAFFPVWSPDGTRIAFNGNLAPAADDFEVYHVSAVDGSALRRVTNSPGFDGRCDWATVRATGAAPPPPPPPPPPSAPAAPSPPPGAGAPSAPASTKQCVTPGDTGYRYPAKMRVSRAGVLRRERRLDVLAPITSRADGGVRVTFFADRRVDRFNAKVTGGRGALDRIRFKQPITRGQADLGTGIVTLNYRGDADTRAEKIRLRAASGRAALDVDRIRLRGDRLSAQGSVTRRAKGVVRLRFSYLDESGRPQVHLARARIQDDGDWDLKSDRVPPQLARCGGHLSIQFTGYFPRRIRGEVLSYELNAGQTRTP